MAFNWISCYFPMIFSKCTSFWRIFSLYLWKLSSQHSLINPTGTFVYIHRCYLLANFFLIRCTIPISSLIGWSPRSDELSPGLPIPSLNRLGCLSSSIALGRCENHILYPIKTLPWEFAYIKGRNFLFLVTRPF